jgi:hypothetical protein
MRNRQEEGREEKFRIYSTQIREEIRQHRPAVVVLSAEILFAGRSGQEQSPFVRFIQSLEAGVHTVAYVRRPSDHFAARAAQTLRGSATLSKPRHQKYKGAVNIYPRLLGGEVSVSAYQPASLIDGDVVTDFTQRFLPEIAPGTLTSVRINEGMSAEMMALVQVYRRALLSHRENAIVTRATTYINMLRDVAVKNSLYRSAKLLQPIVDFIDHGTTDLLWLRKNHGLTFDDVDYGRIEPQRELVLPEDNLSVADLFDVDREIQDKLSAHLVDDFFNLQRKREIRRNLRHATPND